MCSNKQKKWYFVTKIVLTYCECSSDREKLSRICKNFEITRTSERSEQFLVTECFLTCPWNNSNWDLET